MSAGVLEPPARRRRWQAQRTSGRDAGPRPGWRLMDRYLASRTYAPMAAVLSATMLAFLMERVLRALDLLAQTNEGFGYLVGLMVNLTPHYVGLVLPASFFVALFIVVDRLNGQSEIDAMLASGMSLSRIARPFIVLGVVLMAASIVLYGFVQPYSRYGYRAVMHAARNAGWNGEVQAGALLSPDRKFLLTADEVDPARARLERVFIRRLGDGGREDVLTAASAELRRSTDGREVSLELHDGQQWSTRPHASVHLLTFREFTVRLPLTPAARLLRSRGLGEESELTLIELAQRGFGRDPPLLPRQALLAEFYSRLARAFVLPIMPLLALPLGLTAKRAGPRAAAVLAGLLLFSFQTSLVFGQGMAERGAVPAALVIGAPFAIFAAASGLTFAFSRKTPGENPVNWLAEQLSELFRSAAARLSPRARAR